MLSNESQQAKRAKNALLMTVLLPVAPQILGSVFNIWYNTVVVDPLLTTNELKARWLYSAIVYNGIVYPVLIFFWIRLVYSLQPTLKKLSNAESIPAAELRRARRRLIHLPLWASLISAVGWLLGIPVILIFLTYGEPTISPHVLWHLPISFLVSALIAVTHSFFLIELVTHRMLFPLFFSGTRADLIPDSTSLSLRARGLLWILSAGICPIVSLLLLSFAPPSTDISPQWFAVFVGFVGAIFGLLTAILMARLVAEPIDQLRHAAQAVARGKLDVEVPMVRADEFGVLIAEFNHMIAELREKQRLQQTFGLHVGRQAAEQILARNPGLGGVEQTITVMFVDIRSFTARSERVPAPQVVEVLNRFFRVMVEIIEERHGGMVNKFLGDGLLALFGADGSRNHADSALAAAREMLGSLADLNKDLSREDNQEIIMGIGLHTGPAIVGSVGSPQRLEFTAIGSTVNIASRIQSMTKHLETPLLLSEATYIHIRDKSGITEHPPTPMRGIEKVMKFYSL